MAASSKQQQPELALQGSLFGLDPEPTQASDQSRSEGLEPSKELDDNSLIVDAKARPRKRQQAEAEAIDRGEKSSSTNDANEIEAGARSTADDQPAWAHHNLVDVQQLTPMLRHYVELKSEHPERILLYRLGDFFECFFEDAIQLSRLLELTLTGKEGGKAIGRVPMAGIPHHAAERYCTELIRRGLSVALCDQLETTAAIRGPAQARYHQSANTWDRH